MDRRTRIYVWIIIGGIINFVLFGVIYFVLGGDARNGYAGQVVVSDQEHTGDLGDVNYYVRMKQDGQPTEVAWGWFLYSHIHGVTLWITHAAILLAMLTLAKDHIISVLNESYGRFLIHAFVVIVILMVTALTIIWLLDFRHTRKNPVPVTWTGQKIELEDLPRIEQAGRLQVLDRLKTGIPPAPTTAPGN